MNRTLQGTVPSLWFGNVRNVYYDPDADVIKTHPFCGVIAWRNTTIRQWQFRSLPFFSKCGGGGGGGGGRSGGDSS